jgi:hypothetical protein
MSEPKDITATILREMREEFRSEFREIKQKLGALQQRMDGLEAGLHGVQIILVNAVGMFDQRITALEGKVN